MVDYVLLKEYGCCNLNLEDPINIRNTWHPAIWAFISVICGIILEKKSDLNEVKINEANGGNTPNKS